MDDRDREHFLELLEGMVSRYGVVLHAYVLMDNHYPAYAGYAAAPEWLMRQALWARVAADGQDAAGAYRKQIEDYLRQGVADGVCERLTQMLAIGSTVFIEKLQCATRCALRMLNGKAPTA